MKAKEESIPTFSSAISITSPLAVYPDFDEWYWMLVIVLNLEKWSLYGPLPFLDYWLSKDTFVQSDHLNLLVYCI